MKNINKFLMIPLAVISLTQINFESIYAKNTVTKPASYTETHTDGTTKSFSITLSSDNTFATKNTSDDGKVWTNNTGIALKLSYQYGNKSNPGAFGSGKLPKDGTLAMTDQIYTMTITAQ